MRKIAIKIEFDGTDFSGWQMQRKARTVQQCLEQAIQKATDSEDRVILRGAGRTDAGVHAAAQVAHISTDSDIEETKFKHAINYWLPDDVAVIDSRIAHPDFHARFSSLKKTYIYRVLLSNTIRPLRDRYCYRHPPNLNLNNLNDMAETIIGQHDFSSFTSANTDLEDKIRTMYESRWEKVEDEFRYHVTGDGFTYNMIRILVGTMCNILANEMDPGQFKQIIQAKDRQAAGPTAAAKGLILSHIEYPPELDPF